MSGERGCSKRTKRRKRGAADGTSPASRVNTRLGFLGWAQRCTSLSGSLPPLHAGALFGAFTWISVLVSAGCTEARPKPDRPCGEPTPAFRFEATAVQAPLPEELTLRVAFGGAQSESYTLGQTRVGEVACCVTVAQVSDAPRRIPCSTVVESDAEVAPNAIVCDLWTNGAVDLSVSLDEQVLVSQTLQAKLLDEESNCGEFDTLPAQWMLGESDAGVVVDIP